MEERDLNQAAEIEKDAFPTLFPYTSFRRELRNKIARYLVAVRDDGAESQEPGLPPLPEVTARSADGPILRRIVRSARDALNRSATTWRPGQDLIAGYVGLWYMVDEAHVVGIGVRSEYRGLGLGELLFISAIEQAIEMNSRVVTLEVRASNYVARNLYKKYGLAERGVRKGYYSDNREDALIMTSTPIRSDDYTADFRTLIASHESRWGLSDRRTA